MTALTSQFEINQTLTRDFLDTYAKQLAETFKGRNGSGSCRCQLFSKSLYKYVDI